jgi:hypothetical protein
VSRRMVLLGSSFWMRLSTTCHNIGNMMTWALGKGC